MRRRHRSDADPDDTEDLGPSKTQLKRESDELQALGKALLELPDDLLASIDMPERLRDAFADHRRFPTLEAKRRQLQFIGKLLRSADPEPLRQALDAHRRNKARDALTLHEAEMWRERLLAGDEGWQAWSQAFPDGATRALRGLVTSACREQEQAADTARRTGDAPRKGKLYRELFQKIRAVLLQRNEATRETA